MSRNKLICEFGFKNKDHIKLKARCKLCEYKIHKEYKEKNKERLNARDKKYYHENKERLYQSAKIYLANNRDKRNSYIREYKKNRKNTDLSYKIYENSRKRIWKILRKNKRNTTSELLGCSKLFYEMWINFTMIDNMDWKNYGKTWDIDHVIPIKTFNLNDETELKRCFNWKKYACT